MRPNLRLRSALALAVLSALPVTPARATGFTDRGEDLYPREEAWVKFDGWLRVRGESDYNLDLDRGLTAAGKPLYPVPQADPTGQLLSFGDMRLRTDLTFYSPFGGAAVKIRADLLDNLTLGGDPSGAPSTANTQNPISAITLKRAYGEVLTPFGLLSAGRMGADWGLGMLSNGGDCLDCDSGDAADRIAFVTPIAGHIWALAYDFGFAGPSANRRASNRTIDLEPTTDVHTVTFALLSWRDELARNRRKKAGKMTFEYGAVVSHRWQDFDIPAEYIALEDEPVIDAAQVVPRDMQATALDAWFRFTAPWIRAELEIAAQLGEIGQSSLVPGVLLRDPVTTRAVGAAFESDVGYDHWPVRFGLDLGVASGDSDWGMSAAPQATLALPPPGELDGVSSGTRRITHINSFRFHPDYRVDRILFNSIIGTVTNAAYFRPHFTWRMLDLGSKGRMRFHVAGIASLALEAASTPGGESPLGIELDPSITYSTDDGFDAAIDYAVLFPLAGLDNPAEGMTASPGQQVRLRLAYVF
jgi:uncharacterized protein (TIGR04551 family)